MPAEIKPTGPSNAASPILIAVNAAMATVLSLVITPDRELIPLAIGPSIFKSGAICIAIPANCIPCPTAPGTIVPPIIIPIPAIDDAIPEFGFGSIAFPSASS